MARYRRSAGHERARQHIEAAHRFSDEIGGLDRDVKGYFFSLSPDELDEVLDEYEGLYGVKARQYAEDTIPKWESGSVHMSGQTAERLFRLLPKRMPPAKKLALVDALWQLHSPKSECVVRFGPHHTADQVRRALTVQLDRVVHSYTVPDQLRARFEWLADGDAQRCQEMLNHFLERDKHLAAYAIEGLVRAVQQVPETSAVVVQHVRREIVIGGHTVDMVLDPAAMEISVAAGRYFRQSRAGANAKSNETVGCLVAIAIAIVLFVWFLVSKGRSP